MTRAFIFLKPGHQSREKTVCREWNEHMSKEETEEHIASEKTKILSYHSSSFVLSFSEELYYTTFDWDGPYYFVNSILCLFLSAQCPWDPTKLLHVSILFAIWTSLKHKVSEEPLGSWTTNLRPVGFKVFYHPEVYTILFLFPSHLKVFLQWDNANRLIQHYNVCPSHPPSL